MFIEWDFALDFLAKRVQIFGSKSQITQGEKTPGRFQEDAASISNLVRRDFLFPFHINYIVRQKRIFFIFLKFL